MWSDASRAEPLSCPVSRSGSRHSKANGRAKLRRLLDVCLNMVEFSGDKLAVKECFI